MPPTCTPTSLTTLGPGSVAQAGSQLLAELRLQLRSARLYPNGKRTKYLSPPSRDLARLEELLGPVMRMHGGSGRIAKLGLHHYSSEARAAHWG